MSSTPRTDTATGPGATDAPLRLAMHGMAKRYGAVRAIRNADFEVRPGTVHALVGENGAGKSTLIKILAGAVTPDAGTLAIDGETVSIASTGDALALGVATVYQEPQLFAELSVAENIYLGRERRKGPRIDWAAQNAEVVELLELLGLPASMSTRPVGQLSIAQQQQVSIAKALSREARVLILDEPSAILTDAEIEVLYGVVRRLTESGVAVIYISHRLDELFRIADEVTVMRDGETIGTWPIGELDVRRIAELMVGGVLEDSAPPRTVPAGEPRLELVGLGRDGEFHDVDLVVRPGEIVGLYGLVGSGVAEIAQAVYGITHPTSGEMRVDGRAVRPASPRHAQKLGIALLPANRKAEGMFSHQAISFNISVGHLPLLSRSGWVQRRRERQVADDMIQRLAIKTPSQRQSIGAMSGGNAQKVVLARQLVQRPEVLVLAEPTQGVDVGAKEEIHRIVTELADEGTAVLVVTSDLPEALRIADRLLVVRGGTTTREFGRGARQVDVLAAAAGAEDPEDTRQEVGA
ncbi:sugar ABC transporter ATP-binding protein [Nocardioides scoriae]|uniref:sugar ABC transporter ATP-binding protein n=1 Tax=Nocardioides scoriae TaxID=642780 RepID=UPI0018D4D65E|nr:sugar ABC transporter ATP-binding protein [Nocardioides scoriae]